MANSPFDVAPIPKFIQIVYNNGVTDSTTSTTFVDIAGSNTTITPKYSTSNIITIASMAHNVGPLPSPVNSFARVKYLRNGVQVASNSEWAVNFALQAIGDATFNTSFYVYVDTPNTTSAVTYNFQQCCLSSSGTFTVATSNLDIILMEVAA